METVFKIIFTVIGGMAIAFICAVLMGYPTMWLVNYVLTPSVILSLFGTTQITFWKAFALNVLCSVLFQSSSSSSKS